MLIFKQIISVVLALWMGIRIGNIIFNRESNHGPDTNIVKKETFFGDSLGCYKMTPIAHICPLHS